MSSPESRMASMPATMPTWMKRSIFFSSLAGSTDSGLNSLISPAMVDGRPSASNCVIGPIPLTPFSRLFHDVGQSLPTGVTMPSPVMATRRLLMIQTWIRRKNAAAQDGVRRRLGIGSERVSQSTPARGSPSIVLKETCEFDEAAGAMRVRSGAGVFPDEIDGLFYSGNLLGILVRNLGIEFLFERHDKLNSIKRVRTEVVDKRGFRSHLVLVDTELLDD